MENIAAVVILYHPDEYVVNNILSYIEFIDLLIVIDNTGTDHELKDKIKSLSSKIRYIANLENEGIAKSLNKALRMVKGEFNWILTMDQDSGFSLNDIKRFLDTASTIMDQSKDIAVICPDQDFQSLPSNGIQAREILKAITSGSIVNIPVWEQLHGFDERLFIDEVDLEYCYRSVQNGFKIMEIPGIRLDHNLGKRQVAGYFGVLKRSSRIIHSPFRIYYMVRNYLYVSSKYAGLFPDEFRLRKKQFLVTLKNNLLFSGRFFGVLRAMIRGYVDYKTNKFS